MGRDRQRPCLPAGHVDGYDVDAYSIKLARARYGRRPPDRVRFHAHDTDEEVATSLDAEFYLGLPDPLKDRRLPRIHAFKPPQMLLHLDKLRRGCC